MLRKVYVVKDKIRCYVIRKSFINCPSVFIVLNKVVEAFNFLRLA